MPRTGDEPFRSLIDQQFAVDLRDYVGPVEPGAKQLPAVVNDFRGTTNKYGGITRELGFNPFDSSGSTCTECGPLTTVVKAKLLLIKQGHVEQLIADETPADPGSVQLFALDHPVVTIILLWLVGGVILLWGSYLLLPARNRPRLLTLSWDLDGPARQDKITIMFMAPAWFLYAYPASKRREERIQQQIEEIAPEVIETFATIDQMLDDLPVEDRDNPEIKALLDTRRRLAIQLRNQVVKEDTGHVDPALLVSQLSAQLSAAEQILQERKKAVDEYDQDHLR
jgi:hypothetical protein